jgi:hypothetical protein
MGKPSSGRSRVYQPDKLDVELPLAKPVVDEVGQVLLKAADLIKERGLAKGTQRDTDGSLCVHGAISVALFGEPWKVGGDTEPEERLGAFLASINAPLLRTHALAVIVCDYWNNAPERTQEEVIAALEAAAVYHP